MRARADDDAMWVGTRTGNGEFAGWSTGTFIAGGSTGMLDLEMEQITSIPK